MNIEILCIGHAAWDLVLPLESYPEENEKIAVEEVLESAGGPACNAASLLGRWGYACAFAGLVGRDARGGLVLEQLAAAGVDTSLVARPEGFDTPFSVILTSSANASRTIINRRRTGLVHTLRTDLCAAWKPRALLFDGHEAEASLAALELFPDAFSILDAGSRRPGSEMLATCVNYLVSSERFARDMTGRDTRNGAGLAAALRDLHEMNGRQVAITLGERGCVYLLDGAMVAQPAWPARARDTTAAGDIFHGAFAAGLLEGADYPAALRLGTIAAGISVERRGGNDSIPERSEVMARYREIFRMEELFMAAQLKIEIGGVSLRASLYGSTAVQAFAKGLPLDVRMSRWGDEYYGNCGLDLPDDPGERELMQVGELAYWAPGKAFCIFFGRTPASTDERPRAASEVIPLGKIDGDVSALKTLGDSVKARLSLG